MQGSPDSRMSDEELVVRYQKGDIEAFSYLMERYAKVVGAIAKQYDNIPSVDYDDLWQEGMLALHRAASNYQPNGGASFRTYANRVLEHQMIDIFRKYKQGQTAAFVQTVEEGETSAQLEISQLEEEFEQKEQARHYLERVRELLSPYEYQVLTAYVQHQSYAVIARRLDTDEKSVDNALQRIRRKLRP